MKEEFQVKTEIHIHFYLKRTYFIKRGHLN